MCLKTKCRVFLLVLLAGIAETLPAQEPLKLWYDKPAAVWEEALPLGNGKTGAMVFGYVKKERYQLNDNTLWSGYPFDGNNPNGVSLLPQIRQLINDEKYSEADTLWKKMQGPYSARYLPMGDLWLNFNHQDTTISDYRRSLDLAQAISTVEYTLNGVRFNRETFISHAGKVMVIRIRTNKPGTIGFTAGLTSKLKYHTAAPENNLLVLTGKAPKHVAHRDYEKNLVLYDEKEGTNFEIRLKIVNQGGQISHSGNELTVTDANEVTLILSGATSFNGFDKSPGLEGRDPSLETRNLITKASAKSFETLKQAHLKDYQALFKRVSFRLESEKDYAHLPTDQRLKNYKGNSRDYGLQVLYYQFGRYLLIAGSRAGSRPVNLQGIWNDHVRPPWGSNYTTNINLEMNYWPAENTNLPECHQPLFNFIDELVQNGAKTARINYGIEKGWTVHHNTDIWAKTSTAGGYDWDPRGQSRWSCWPMGGAWLSTHLWEHYLFTGDREFLKTRAYPLMKGAAEFLLGWLTEDPKTGFMVTNPSTSPENTAKINGKEYQMTQATTMDISLVRELFTGLIKASEILDTDEEFRRILTRARDKLYPFQIGKHGQLQEWYGDWDDPKDTHRHISHLYSLYPGNQISPGNTPELASAAKQSLLHRGDVSTGWSMAWKINWWARLHDGDHALSILNSAFNYINPAEKREQMSGGGTYPNLFDAHPPFQIDGNFGASAGITEMLLQSHDGRLSILPALPAAWKSGAIAGIRARGNFEVSVEWKDQHLVQSKILSLSGGNCRVRTIEPVEVLEIKSNPASGENPNILTHASLQPPFFKKTDAALLQLRKETEYIIDFKTEKGKTYTIIPLKK